VPVWEHTAPAPALFLFPMKKHLPILLGVLGLAAVTLTACKDDNKPEPIDKNVITFTETDELFPNPEKGWLIQTYYTSADLDAHMTRNAANISRQGPEHVTLYLHSYYLTDYMECDIPQAFLDRLEANMNTLREGGAKVVLRFSYKSNESPSNAPWDATPEWVHRHIDQIAPYLHKHADVILCVQCGFIGVWGEWYYTSHFKMNPNKDSDFEPRWEVLEHMLQAVPEDRQVALRTPAYKMRYLQMRGLGATPLTAAEAYQPTNKARICGHNDCFVSSSNDVGTYNGKDDRLFWQEDSKYTFMGGETCQKCQYSNGENAIGQMELYHWTYLNRDYEPKTLKLWRQEGTFSEIQRRLGYLFVLEKMKLKTEQPKAGGKWEADLTLHNRGFAALVNKRAFEIIFVNAADAEDKYVFPQTEDPRTWQPGEHTVALSCTLNDMPAGEYKVYMNLPDPYASLHDNPLYSIRLSNTDVWDEATGYNLLTTVKVE